MDVEHTVVCAACSMHGIARHLVMAGRGVTWRLCHVSGGGGSGCGGLGVRYLVLPSLRRLLPMWLERFGCQPLTLAEAQALESRIVFPDTDSAQLLKKALLQAPEWGTSLPYC